MQEYSPFYLLYVHSAQLFDKTHVLVCCKLVFNVKLRGKNLLAVSLLSSNRGSGCAIDSIINSLCSHRMRSVRNNVGITLLYLHLLRKYCYERKKSVKARIAQVRKKKATRLVCQPTLFKLWGGFSTIFLDCLIFCIWQSCSRVTKCKLEMALALPACRECTVKLMP